MRQGSAYACPHIVKANATSHAFFSFIWFSQELSTFETEFQQDRIYITRIQDSQTGFDYTPYQKALPENTEDKFNYTPYIASLLEYMMDQGMNITPIPSIKTVKDPQQANDLFGKTATTIQTIKK